MEFMPRLAPFVLLMFLGTAFLLGVSGLVFLYGLIRKNRLVIRAALLSGIGLAAAYFGLLLIVSAASHERVLAPGEQKYFCEIDCHEAYSVAGVTRAEGTAPNTTRYLVRVKVWFDKDTISSRRPLDVPLYPNPRTAYIADASGSKYFPKDAPQGLVAAFTRPIRPGESYLVDLAFNLPAAIVNPRLYITNGELPTRLLIGHENSPFHAKIWFALEPAAPTGRANPS